MSQNAVTSMSSFISYVVGLVAISLSLSAWPGKLKTYRALWMSDRLVIKSSVKANC